MKLRFTKYGLPAVALAMLCSPMRAQTPLPEGSAVLDKYVEVTGGRAAYEKLRSEVQTATMEIAGQGVRFTMTIYRAAPNKSYVVMEMPGMGKIEEGTDGKVVWSLSAIQGPRIKEGAEKSMGLLAATFNGDLRWRELYKSAETVGVEDVEGGPCYKVVLTGNDGLIQTRYYSTKTGLIVKTIMTVKTQMGEIPTESVVSDYRDAGGVLVPYKSVSKILTQQLVMTVENVKPNAEIDASRFALPDEIKALLQKSEGQ